jgi:hypothetical protein
MTTSPIFTFSDDIHNNNNNSNNTEQSTKPSTPPSPSSASYLSSSSPSVSSAPSTVSSHSTTSSNLSVHPVPSFTLPGPSPSSPSSSHRIRGSSFKLPTKKSKVRKPAPNFPNGEAHSNNANNTGNVPTSSSGLSSSAGAGGTGGSRLAGGAGGVPNGPPHYSMVEDIHNPWRMIIDAVKHDTKQLYKLIHQQGIDVNIRDKDGQSVLHVAAAETDAEELLLILMGCRANIQVSDNKRWTPLHVACNAGNELLLSFSSSRCCSPSFPFFVLLVPCLALRSASFVLPF